MRRRCCAPPRLALPEPLPRAAPPRATLGATEAPARRILALHLPRFAAEGFGEGPLLVWRAEGPRRVVLAADAAAEALGVRPGQPLADAQAIAPSVRAEAETPAAHAARLEALALWALRFTPLAAADPPDGLLLDITGCAHLAGGEQALLERAVAGLAVLGHAAQGAVAGTPEAAAALARAGFGGAVPAGAEAEVLGPLSPALLRLPEATVSALSRVGLRSVGEVLAQPRAPLVRRFGAGLLAVLDAATGRLATPIRPIRPPPDLAAARDLPEPIITREAIDALVALLLPELCAALDRAGRGLRRLTLRAHRVDGAVQEIAVGAGAATRDAAHLSRLLQQRLERLDPGFGFDRMELLAERTEPLAPGQWAIGAASEELAPLLDRLAQRVVLWRARPRPGHWPERAVERVAPQAPVAAPPGWPARPRPVRLLRRPDPVEAMALLPDAPPRRLFWRGAWRSVDAAEGPERIEPEWWRDAPGRAARDYYRIACAGGVRLWVCAVGRGADRRWFVHGVDA
jgi:protein ImuB